MLPRLAIVSNARPLRLWLVTALVVVISGPAFAGAPYCALRDPGHQIYDMYPAATGYRSVVREINNATQLSVDSQIPFRLHSGELGQHTLYVPVAGERPLGYIQIRSELTQWGLAEIVWALDMRLQVRDFRFQRCRGRACRSVLDNGLAELLRDKDRQQLIALLDGAGHLLPAHAGAMNDQERQLAGVVIRSAVKVSAVIESGWSATLQELGSGSADT